MPADQIDNNMRKHVKQYCEAMRLGNEYRIPESDFESWMPTGRPGDELFAMQKNARKDGTFFNNMFYMKASNLSARLHLICMSSSLDKFVLNLYSIHTFDVECLQLGINIS